MNLRLPFHIAPSTFIVIDGPPNAGAEIQMDKMWRACHGLGHGTKPLFDRVPLFTYRPEQPGEEAAHWELVVEPTLADGQSVFMQGRYATEVADPSPLIFIVNPDRACADDEIPLLGDDGEVGESLFDEMLFRGLYGARSAR
jgi:hypothetical protein